MPRHADASPKQSSQTARHAVPEYAPPRHGVLSYLPASWVPYGELTRIDKPAGFILIYFPHLFGSLYAAAMVAGAEGGSTNAVTPRHIIRQNLILFLGSVLSRSAICCWNDVIDREYDRQVLRCRLRPIARRAISPFQGLLLTAALTMLSLACLFSLPRNCWVISVPDILLMALYPFTKRFLNFPQAVLGAQVSLAFFLGGFAIDDNFIVISEMQHKGVADLLNDHEIWAMISFYLANVCWTIVYDTVYAQQDVEDDAKAGIRSMAVHFKGQVKALISAVSAVQVALLFGSGHWQGFGGLYTAFACVGTGSSLIYMIATTDLNDPRHCAWFFRTGQWLVNLSITGGLVAEWLGLSWML